MAGGTLIDFMRLRNLRKLLGWIRLSFRTIAGTGRWLGGVTAITAVSTGLFSVAMSVAMANIIGAAPQVGISGLDSQAGNRLTVATGAYVALLALQGVITSMVDGGSQWVGRQVDGRLRERVMKAALMPPGIRHLEDESFRQALDQARNAAPVHGMTPGAIAAVLPSVVGQRVRMLAYLIGLTYVAWPVGLAFALMTLKTQDEMQKAIWRVVGGGGVPPPTVDYQLELGTSAAPGKEVRVFGLGEWVSERYRTGMFGHIRNVWLNMRDFTPSFVITLAANAALTVFALVWLGFAALNGSVGVGELAFALVAIVALNPSGAFSQDDLPLAFAATTIETIEAAEKTVSDPSLRIGGSKSASELALQAIRFENVTFRYPGTGVDVLRNLDVELRSNQRIALVGLNGAGKTTLVKLLCGLYEPTDGRILVDGRHVLSELDPESWRERLAVLFQDFLQYELSARDNVRYGAVTRLVPDPNGAIERAAVLAGISRAIDALPNGWDSPLSPGFVGGASLSGGQWQRLAMARALFAVEAGARVLVLDEPTANLDVRAEAEIYDSLLALTREALTNEERSGLTTLLISHRFSTVRQADRIAVLDEGHIVEEGSHAELLDRDGLYSRMFRAQAEQFADSGKRPETEESE